MNKGDYNDIKLCERLIMKSSIYLLDNFEKKIDSFVDLNTKKKRIQKKQANLHPKNEIDPDTFFENPIKNLSADMTKPIWNCIMKINPIIILEKANQQISNHYCQFIYNIQQFIHRYSRQHSDQSNLKLVLHKINKNQQFLKLQKQNDLNQIQIYIKQLFTLLLKCNKRQKERINNKKYLIQFEYNNNNYQQIENKGQQFLIQSYLNKQNGNKEIKQEMEIFIKIVVEHMNYICDHKCGSTVICLQPLISFINLLIHPLLIAIYNILKVQINSFDSKMNEQNIQQYNIKQQNKIIFTDIKATNNSKIIFINLDGYQNQYNIDIARYFTDYLMYISFPRQNNSINSNNYHQYKSNKLLRKYFMNGLTSKQKEQLFQHFQNKQFCTKRNIYILPIYSSSLDKKYQLSTIQYYESTYIRFMMRQLLMNQIRQFNPSMIVISYNGNITIQNQHFIELITDLTVLSNFRMIFYINQSYNMMQKINNNLLLSQELKLYLQLEQKEIQQQMNKQLYHEIDLYIKLSIYIKISSGTHNLIKNNNTYHHNYNVSIEKYKNHKVMKYAGLIFKILSLEFITIERIKFRIIQYITVSKVINNFFKNNWQNIEKNFNKFFSKFYKEIINEVTEILIGHNSLKYLNLLQIIDHKYGCKVKQLWQDYKFCYYLSICTEKIQNRVYLHLPRQEQNQHSKKSTDNLIAVQFQIVDSSNKIAVQINKIAQICYNSKNKSDLVPIFLLNHLGHPDDTYYHSYYGFIGQNIENNPEMKVQLKKLQFVGGPTLAHSQYYCKFNYFETQNYIFLFWPCIHNEIHSILSQFAAQKYFEQCTKLIFRCNKQHCNIFYNLQIHNISQYKQIIPRYGCICYQVQGCNRIHIMGGFYHNYENHLRYQTDITIIQYDQSDFVKVNRITKQFYYGFNNQSAIINSIKNDMIRPRIQYNIIQINQNIKKNDIVEQNIQLNDHQILLAGGIGQKFTRPYSLITYMMYRIVFDTKGYLISIRRVHTNNLIPANLCKPISTLPGQTMSIAINAQNRNIYLSEGTTNSNASILSHYIYRYNQKQQKLQYETQYNFAINDYQVCHQQIKSLQSSSIEYNMKSELIGRSIKGMNNYSYITNHIVIHNDQKKKILIQLKIELSMDVYSKFVDEIVSKQPTLTNNCIISIDIFASIVYAVIKHIIYTKNRCMLTMYNLNQLNGKFISPFKSDIVLKQIYKFQQSIQGTVLMIANTVTIAILHGCSLDQFTPPQMILKKDKRHEIKTEPIQKCNDLILLEKVKLYTEGWATSLFIRIQNIIMCFTFKCISYTDQYCEQVYTAVEQLDISLQKGYIWKKKIQKVSKFVHQFKHKHDRDNRFKLIELKASKNSNKDPIYFRLMGLNNQKCTVGVLKLQQSDVVEFKSIEHTPKDYYKFVISEAKIDSILLDKNQYIYDKIKYQKKYGKK